jgi:hypothetical protein
VTAAAGPPLVRRIVRDYRAIVIALAAVLFLNVAVYAAFVFPLSRRVGSVAERTQAAERDLADARAQQTRASATLSGKAKAAEELTEFYTKVLPPDVASARRLSQLRLTQLARDAEVQIENTKFTEKVEHDSSLARLSTTMVLTGTYPAVRRLINDQEHLPEFVVVDRLGLSETSADESVLTMRHELSTYYRNTAE